MNVSSSYNKIMGFITLLHIIVISGLYYLGVNVIAG